DEASQALSFTVNNDNNALFATQPAVSSVGTLTYTPAPNANGSATVTVQLHDNGGRAKCSENTRGSEVSEIDDTAANATTSLTTGADQTVLEDAGAQTVTNWATNISAGGPDEAAQVLNFIVNNDNNALFGTQPGISPSGTLTYTPAANANGSATVTVQLHDNGGGSDMSAAQMFVITVTAVNDAPSFQKGADQSAAANSGGHGVESWATAISAGPADESAQALNFVVTNDNNGLFAVQPAVSPSGSLTF